MQDDKRIALLLTGNLRTWDLCKESFIKTFSNNIDIFICVSNLKYDYAPYIQENYTGADEYNLSETDIKNSFDGLNLKKLIIQNKEEEVSYISNEQHKFKMDVSGINVFGTFGNVYKIKKALSLVEEYENEHGFKYDTIIKTRFDAIYNQINLNLSNETILIDQGNCFPNDHFLMANRNSMANLINFMHDEFYEPKHQTSHFQPPHGLLHNAIYESALKVESRSLINYILRKDYGPQRY
jgi:hypothetical protein